MYSIKKFEGINREIVGKKYGVFYCSMLFSFNSKSLYFIFKYLPFTVPVYCNIKGYIFKP